MVIVVVMNQPFSPSFLSFIMLKLCAEYRENKKSLFFQHHTDILYICFPVHLFYMMEASIIYSYIKNVFGKREAQYITNKKMDISLNPFYFCEFFCLSYCK